MLRLAAVSYLNTVPLLEGLRRSYSEQELELITDVPARCAQRFERGACDVVLTPVGATAHWPEVQLLGQTGIAAEGRVDSVFILAEQPLDKIKRLYLDPHSRSSNGLARILLADHWRVQPELVQVEQQPERFSGAEAGVVIGDRAMLVKPHYPVVLDLAEHWGQLTGLPMVFAVWAVRPGALNPAQAARLEQAFSWGLDHLPELAAHWGPQFGFAEKQALDYYRRNIQFRLGPRHRQAVRRYLQRLCQLDGLPQPRLQWLSPPEAAAEIPSTPWEPPG